MRATPTVTLGLVEEALKRRTPRAAALEGNPARAGVALLLEPRREDVHLFFIHRAVDDRDPWSGHMGFPGGFVDDGDSSVLAAVAREVSEETRIDLHRSARCLGPLDELQGVARGRQLSLVISPFVFALEEPVQPVPNEEVQGILWVPLSFLADSGNEAMVEHRVQDQRMSLPAFVYENRTIWGLTFRMVQNLLEIVGARQGGAQR